MASSEAAALAVQLGADLATVQDVIGTSFGSSAMLLRNLPRFIAHDFTPATPIGLIAKDLSIIHTEAANAGVPLLLGALVEQFYLEAKARGWTGEDMSALIRFWDRDGECLTCRSSQRTSACSGRSSARTTVSQPRPQRVSRMSRCCFRTSWMPIVSRERSNATTCTMVSFDPAPGNWSAGERGYPGAARARDGVPARRARGDQARREARYDAGSTPWSASPLRRHR